LKSTTVSDSTKATVTASSSAPNGTQKLNIIQVAQAGYLTGGKLDSSTTTGTTLAELGYTGGDGTINVTMGDGTTTAITVSQGTTVNSFITSLKEAGLSANYDETNKRIYVSSKTTGKDNDFTLTGANIDGVDALYRLGLNPGSSATDATYTSYTKYYNADGTVLEQNVVDAINAYKAAKEEYATKSAQNANLSAAYGYASAYAAMEDALQKSGLSTDEQKKLQTLLGMTATERVNTLMDADGNVYTQKATDADGNAIFSYTDDAGNEKLLQRVITYTDETGKSYTLNDDKTYTDDAGTVYKATSEKDADGNVIYADADGNKATIKTETSYYAATSAEVGTGFYKLTDADGNTYTENDDHTYAGTDGTKYRLTDDGKLVEIDSAGADVTGGKEVTVASNEEIAKTEYTQGAVATGINRSTDVFGELKEDADFALTDDELDTLTSNVKAVNTFETASDELASSDPYSRVSIATAIKDAYAANGSAGVTALANTYAQIITDNKADITDAEATMEEHQVLAKLAAIDTSTTEGAAEYATALADFVNQVNNANAITTSATTKYNTDAKKIDGTDSKITLNGIEYESSLNTYSINGLNITAQQATGEGDDNAISITTSTDTQGIYDKIKDFLTQYNALINELTSLYNADSAKGYEPLSDDEKDAMSDTEIEKWEEKIKASLLRRDDSLESVMNAMTSSMSKGVKIGDKTYYLSSFGIKTLGYLNAPENQHNAYHIDGDEDDAASSGNTDKLMAAITSDPDTVVSFMQQLASNLYTAVGDKMKSTTLSSTYTVYNDKEMASEYSDYTDLIKKWEEKLQAQEDYYYNKFSAMETALSKLNSQTSSLSSMLGG
jgi:flagellar hook-associated protein 2